MEGTKKKVGGAKATIGEAHVRAHAIANDSALMRLKHEHRVLEAELKEAELRVPENVRDLETLEAHLKGETRGDTREIMAQFIESYTKLKEYADLLKRKWALEREIVKRRTELGLPPY